VATDNPFETTEAQPDLQKTIHIKPSVTTEPVAATTSVVSAPKPAPIGVRPQSISIIKPKQVEVIKTDTEQKEIIEQISTTNAFTDEDFIKAWSTFINTLPLEKKVGFTNLDLPVRKTVSNFEVLVNNVMQDNEINRLLSDAVQFIRKQLSNTNISIATKIAEESEIQRSLTPEQRYNEMVAKNPQLEQFRKMLSLEID
jgi:DNA polymerase-3 subunit gamma/tau